MRVIVPGDPAHQYKVKSAEGVTEKRKLILSPRRCELSLHISLSPLKTSHIFCFLVYCHCLLHPAPAL